MNVNPLGNHAMNGAIPLPPAPPLEIPGTASPVKVDGSSFKNLLVESLREVNSMQQDAQKAVEQLATGDDVNMAEVMTAVQKADMSFRLMVQMRNKLVQAYNEIRQIQI